MNKNVIWKIILFAGFLPFIIPVIWGIYHISVQSASFSDFIILYSFLYWPAYIIGIILIVLSFIKLFKRRT